MKNTFSTYWSFSNHGDPTPTWDNQTARIKKCLFQSKTIIQIYINFMNRHCIDRARIKIWKMPYRIVKGSYVSNRMLKIRKTNDKDKWRVEAWNSLSAALKSTSSLPIFKRGLRNIDLSKYLWGSVTSLQFYLFLYSNTNFILFVLIFY